MTHPDRLEIFASSIGFDGLGVRSSLQKALAQAGFRRPTPLQVCLIPPLLAGQSILVQARAGMGKVAAYSLPLLHQADPQAGLQALILTPTRSWAAIVAGEIALLSRFSPIRTAALLPTSTHQPIAPPPANTHLLVCTPSDLSTLSAQHPLALTHLRWLILDGLDQMLTPSIQQDLENLLPHLPSNPPQTILVTATLHPDVEIWAARLLPPEAPRFLDLPSTPTCALAEHRYTPLSAATEKDILLEQLLRRESPSLTLIYCQSQATANLLARWLRNRGLNVTDRPPQPAARPRPGSSPGSATSVLLTWDGATDPAHFCPVSHLVYYDLPEDPNVYLHRTGQIARAEKKGWAWTLVGPEHHTWPDQFHTFTDLTMTKMEYASFQSGPRSSQTPAPPPSQASQSTGSFRALVLRANRLEPIDQLSPQELARRFPGGVLPQTTPPPTLARRFRSRRR